MAFLKLSDFNTKLIRSLSALPASSPQPIQKGTIVLSSDLSFVSVCAVAGHLGGDNFYTQFTAGSNVVKLPINTLAWSGLKLYAPQFPSGVLLTGKGVNTYEYTIATPATVTAKQFSNFCLLKSVALQNFLGK